MVSDKLANDVLRAIRRIVRKTSEHSRQLVREAGLTVPQVLCMRCMADAGPDEEMTVARISQAVQLSPATVSRILDRLERAKLVVRERRSQDRRKVCLSLTERGAEHIKNLPVPLQEQFARRFASLPPDEQRALLASLQKIVEMMEASDLDAAPLLDSADPPARGPHDGK